MWVWFTQFDQLGPYDPLTKKMSPMDYDTVVNVEAYSLVKTPRMLPWDGNMMGFLTVPLTGNYGWNRRVIKNDLLLPTTPSSTSLDTCSPGKLRRKRHKGIWGVGFARSALSPRFLLFRRGTISRIFDIIEMKARILLTIVLGSCCRSKPAGEQWQATRRAGRLPELLVGPSPLVNGPRSGTRPGFEVARHATWPCTWSGRCYILVSCIHRHA
jgi:hypothetical protein